jgi:hypothetical protein
MKRGNRGIVNPRQQPGRRNYTRERDQYHRDEARDFANGVDYIRQGRRLPDSYRNRDYATNNLWHRRYQDQREFGDDLYTPSADYGYERNEYYSLDPSHDHYNRGEAVGYGSYNSPYSRDFENWLHQSGRYRNFRNDIASEHDYRNDGRSRPANHDFEEGLYSYDNEQRYQRGSSRNRRTKEPEGFDRYQNRSDRHPVIVRPFKDEKDYGRNDYNYSEGFGSNEMAYHENNDDERRGHWIRRRRRD